MLNRLTIAIRHQLLYSRADIFAINLVRKAEPHSRIEFLFDHRLQLSASSGNIGPAAPGRFQMVTSQRCHKPAFNVRGRDAAAGIGGIGARLLKARGAPG